MVDQAQLVDWFHYVEPYLPTSVVNVKAALSNPSQLLPIVLSLFALYLTVTSALSSARFFFRATYTLVKYAVIGLTLASGLQKYHDWGKPASEHPSTPLWDRAGQAYRLGRSGWHWYSGSQASQTRPSRRSASGTKRTWSTPTDDGDWDDPDEVDLGKKPEDVLQWLQDTVLTFVSSPPAAAANPPKRQRGRKPKATRNDDASAPDLVTGWMGSFARKKAEKVWNDMVGT